MASSDYSQTTDDSTAVEDTGKKTLFGKIKDKTKGTTTKLKAKMQKTGGNEENLKDDTSSPDSSEDEADEPVRNAFQTGVTQPGYENLLREGATPKSQEGAADVAKPATHFPGDFTGIVDDASNKKVDETSLSEDFGNLSTNDQKVEEKSLPEKAEDAQTGEAFSENSNNASTTEPVKSWSTWAAEKVGYAKDTAAAKMPTTEQGKPVHEEAFDQVHANVIQPSYDQAIKAKDAIAEKAAPTEGATNSPTDGATNLPTEGETNPAQQTYVQKATSGIYAMKGNISSSTAPQDHDKALSQKITESVSNLPTTIKSSLGFGGTAAPASTPGAPQDQDKAFSQKVTDSVSNLPATVKSTFGYGGTASPATTPDAPQESTEQKIPPQSPGIVDRFTSIFASPKKPVDAEGESTPGEVTETTT